MIRHDRLHLRRYPRRLLVAQRPQIALRDRHWGHHVRFARGHPTRLGVIQLRRRAT
jgi:hypothetical protein